jgi:acyl carrier protein
VSVEQDVKSYIIENLGWDRDASELTDDYPLIERGALDSMGIFKLVTHLETKYDVDVEDEELVPKHFGTISSIASLIRSKT